MSFTATITSRLRDERGYDFSTPSALTKNRNMSIDSISFILTERNTTGMSRLLPTKLSTYMRTVNINENTNVEINGRHIFIRREMSIGENQVIRLTEEELRLIVDAVNQA